MSLKFIWGTSFTRVPLPLHSWLTWEETVGPPGQNTGYSGQKALNFSEEVIPVLRRLITMHGSVTNDRCDDRALLYVINDRPKNEITHSEHISFTADCETYISKYHGKQQLVSTATQSDMELGLQSPFSGTQTPNSSTAYKLFKLIMKVRCVPTQSADSAQLWWCEHDR